MTILDGLRRTGDTAGETPVQGREFSSEPAPEPSRRLPIWIHRRTTRCSFNAAGCLRMSHVLVNLVFVALCLAILGACGLGIEVNDPQSSPFG
jgi:hypothetical protein